MTPLHLAIALDGAGWHPAAWREPTARPAELFTAGYWVDLVRSAEAGLLDFVTVEDSFDLPPLSLDPQHVQGRLDAVLTACRVAPLTERIGLVPTQVATHTEPFHAAKAIATLDFVSRGRAGTRIQVSHRATEFANVGRRTPPDVRDADQLGVLFDEAADHVEVSRRLWDSWEDDAEIRDAATGRFIDRSKVHYIDFAGDFFSVKGPSIVPRPPQGQPVVTALAHVEHAYRLAARSADIVFVTPRDADDAAHIVGLVREAEAEAGREQGEVRVFADLVVFLDRPGESGAARRARLDAADGTEGTEYASDAAILTGSAALVADVLASWQHAGISGYRLRPAALPDDLDAITADLVPELQSRGLFRREYAETTLRERLGLDRPPSRYASAAAATAATGSTAVTTGGVA
ncbi:LLM class flavin-dependent oxidoreductase [Nakamurella flavida]|uniref:LLM class flavin-dependent oxidoreductase n=1 Tax=Nakamurella flavida TaxID=363630 RepID=A0A939C1D4_9ACTN|nr:LLM class flavin-dependent oxidoreductase [Nakamurella flavida]MBM9475350.1 LLM class flavin-dependent oxidoreductase [Nakamurella flavida]MDP9776928.1 alkanesulfonate monooxygenase SsuD/methylene tetrahydromethanopterin reductase-like flavin-dependent oxidoreductase (luciferase family) [Nakamurella flavida]